MSGLWQRHERTQPSNGGVMAVLWAVMVAIVDEKSVTAVQPRQPMAVK